jgi:hypothetical protein
LNEAILLSKTTVLKVQNQQEEGNATPITALVDAVQPANLGERIIAGE